MNIFKKWGAILLSSFILLACSNDDTDGDWDDNIHLSQKNIKFSAERNSVLITTEGEGWWVSNISFVGTTDYQNNEPISGNFLLIEENFKLERRTATELFVELTANSTSTPRMLRIGLQNGNYFDGITISQETK